MKLFRKKEKNGSVAKQTQTISAPELYGAQRSCSDEFSLPASAESFEMELYDRLRYSVPIIDASLMKIVRLTGGFRVICSDEKYQSQLDTFLSEVPVGNTGKSINAFADCFLDNLLTYGSAVAELVPDIQGRCIAGIYTGNPTNVKIVTGKNPFVRRYCVKQSDGSYSEIRHPERILYSSLTGGHSVLRGLPALSGILMKIYRCIGQNFDRAGNVRYAVTYRPSGDVGDVTASKERALQIAREWSDGMNCAKYGQVKDFIAVGDIDIKVIGAENQMFDTNIPVRQLLEQLIAKLSIPPFLLGLSWSSTERMSSQQADILTSELEYYRRILTPVIRDIGNAYLCSRGYNAVCRVEWDNINLQDEQALADARLKNAQAREIEMRLAGVSEENND